MGNETKLATLIEKLKIKLNTLDDRKICQKEVYFLQQFGLNLGYDFGFYIYGPYSSDLTKDAFAYFEQNNIAPKTIEREPLTEEDKWIIDKFTKIISSIGAEKLADKLELMASIHFLKVTSNIKLDTLEDIYKEINKRKPDRFSKENVEEAIELLKQNELIK